MLTRGLGQVRVEDVREALFRRYRTHGLLALDFDPERSEIEQRWIIGIDP